MDTNPEISSTNGKSACENTKTIDMLPNSVLLEVFSYLTPHELSLSVLPVCQKWRDIGNHASLWKYMDFGDYCPEKLNHYIELVKRHPRVQSIVCRHASDAFLRVVAAHCHALKRLVVPQTGCLSPKTMKMLDKGCPHITLWH